MADNTILIYSIAAVGLLAFGLLFIKLRTSYIKSLYDKINEQEVMIGKTINQLAMVKTLNKDLTQTNQRQLEQINKISKVNNSHSEKLADSYRSSQKLINDLKQLKQTKTELEQQIAEIDLKHEVALNEKMEEFERVESSYKKVSHSLDIVQKSNDNLREERDFYRNEFIKLRDNFIEKPVTPKLVEVRQFA